MITGGGVVFGQGGRVEDLGTNIYALGDPKSRILGPKLMPGGAKWDQNDQNGGPDAKMIDFRPKLMPKGLPNEVNFGQKSVQKRCLKMR